MIISEIYPHEMVKNFVPKALVWLSASMLAASPIMAQLRPNGGMGIMHTLPIHPRYPAITRQPFVLQLGVSQPVDGSKAWHHLYRDAQLSYQFLYVDPGNPDVLGQAISAAIWLDLHIQGTKQWQLRYAIGVGPSLMTRPVDRVHNPGNIAYGGHLTDLVGLRLYLRHRPSAHFVIDVGASALHYSSAQVRVPNVGLNLVGGYVSVRGTPRETRPLVHTPAQVTTRGIRPGIRLGLGLQSRKVPDGPIYAVYNAMAYATYQPLPKIRFAAGIKAFYHDGLYEFFQTQDYAESNDRRLATALIAWGGAEWLLGHIGINLKLGPYLTQATLMPYTLYTEMGLQYYWHDTQQRDGPQPYVGLYVHAHSGQADWGELAIGVSF